MIVDPGRRRVSSSVALTLLKVIRDQDRPAEVLEAENTSVTMPRKLGLSEVVERRIRNYRVEARRGAKISDSEFGDLVRLVIRRPDSQEVFRQSGNLLAGDESVPTRPRRLLPRSLVYALARRRVKRRLKALFGRRVGGFGAGPFTMEGRSLLFIQADPGGDACELVAGLCESLLSRAVGSSLVVRHVACESRGDPFCRWIAVTPPKPAIASEEKK
jgi:hypothetical protein